MKTVNAPYGYDPTPAQKPIPWYHWPQFPVLPIWDYRQGDKWNTNAWSFSWLFFRYWSLDHLELKIEIGFDATSLGGSAFRIGAILPYTRLVFSIPFPLGWLDRFRRRPPGELELAGRDIPKSTSQEPTKFTKDGHISGY